MTKRYKVVHVDGLTLGATGDSWRRGEWVTDDGLPAGMAEALEADGVIEEMVDVPAEPPRRKRRRAKAVVAEE